MAAGAADTNPETEEQPFKTVQRAAHAGTWRYFFLILPRGGLASYAHQSRSRCVARSSALSAICTSSTTWKSNMPTHTKSAPCWKA